MPRSLETAGSAMFTMVASRMTISTVTAMTARASQRLRVGLVVGEGRAGRGGGGGVGHGSPRWSMRMRAGSSAEESNVAACDHVVVPVSLVLTSDTHVPQRSRDLPHSLWAAIEAADVVVHAGDWVDVALLDQFEARSRRLVGVYGNNDHGALRERLPEVARAEIEGIRIAVVHETGDRKGREERCAARFPDVDVLVFGHSHIPWDTTAPRRAAAAQPRLADRPAPPAARHLRHRGRPPTASCGTSPSTPSRPARERRASAGAARGRAAGLPGVRRARCRRATAGCAAPPGTRSTAPGRGT